MSNPNSPSCYTTTTLFPCGTNLIDWILSKGNKVFGKGIEKLPPQQFIERILDKGIVTTMCNVCCPCPGSPYVLASVETYLKHWEGIYNVQQVNTVGDTCCTSFQNATETLFDDCFQVSSSGQCVDRVLDKGIVEEGLINGQSQLQSVLDWVISIIPIAGNDTACEILDRLLDKGIVIFCEPESDRVIIAAVETYLKYNEAVLPEVSPSCCTNVFSSVETYLKFAEPVGFTGSGPVPA